MIIWRNPPIRVTRGTIRRGPSCPPASPFRAADRVGIAASPRPVMIELRETISVKAHWISHDQNLSIMIRTQQRHGKRTGLDTAKINCDEPESHST
jgi:hypothetical protein